MEWERVSVCMCVLLRGKLTFDWLQHRLGKEENKDKAPVPDRAQPVRLELIL